MISIEGNIGAGKSFLCGLLQAANLSVASEPVNDWILGNNNVLAAFYSNPKKYACLFQTLVLRSRVEQVRTKPTIVERCVHSDKIFATVQHELGNMDDVEYAAYLYQYEQAVKDTPAISKYIYVKTPVNICLQRIASRNREEENGGVPGWYVERLQQAHDNWLTGNPNVLVLDGAEDWNNPKLASQVVETVKAFYNL